jgi:hypothetical protein
MENKIILQASQISIGILIKPNNSSLHFYFFKKGKLIALIGANGIEINTLRTITGIQTASWCCFE